MWEKGFLFSRDSFDVQTASSRVIIPASVPGGGEAIVVYALRELELTDLTKLARYCFDWWRILSPRHHRGVPSVVFPAGFICAHGV